MRAPSHPQSFLLRGGERRVGGEEEGGGGEGGEVSRCGRCSSSHAPPLRHPLLPLPLGRAPAAPPAAPRRRCPARPRRSAVRSCSSRRRRWGEEEGAGGAQQQQHDVLAVDDDDGQVMDFEQYSSGDEEAEGVVLAVDALAA